MPSPVSRSPLKVVVTEKGTVMTATDPDGNIVLEGVRGTRAEPAAAAQITATGTWTIAKRVQDNAAVHDAAGVPVAEIRRGGFARDTIVTGDGTEIAVGRESFKPGYGASFGPFGRARSPWLRSGRSFKLTLSDELLARADHEMLIAVFAHVGRQKIVAQRQSDASSGVAS